MKRFARAMKRSCDAMLGIASTEEQSKCRKVSEPSSTKGNKEDDAKSPAPGRDGQTDNNVSSGSQHHASKSSVRVSEPIISSTQAPVASALSSPDATKEEPECTEERPRIVRVRGTDRERLALLLAQQLSQKLQNFVTAENKLALSTIHQARSKPILAAFEEYYQREYERQAQKYESLEELSGRKSEAAACVKEVEAINDKLKRAAEVEEHLADAITDATNVAQRARLEAAGILEEVFQGSSLLPSVAGPEVDSELLREFQIPDEEGNPDTSKPSSASENSGLGRCRSSSSLGEIPTTWPRHHPPSPPGDIEELERLQDLRNAYWKAHDELNQAQLAFDQRASKRDNEAAVLRAKLASGQQTFETAVDFDLRHLLEGRELTRRLIHAEKAFYAAKGKAVEAYLKIGADDQSSGFVSESQDGASSGEVSHKDRVHKPTIQAWLDRLPDYDGGEWDKLPGRRLSEIDATENETDSINIGDSASAVADGSERRKIDKWQKKCEELRQD